MGAAELAVLRNWTGALVIDETRVRIDELSKWGKRLRRRILEPEVLRGILPLRARAIRQAGRQAESRDRERRFSQASPAYARAIVDTEDVRADIRIVSLDSLTWCVPLTAPDDPVLVERALKHQDFPYRAMTQTREVAIGGTMVDIGANTGRMSIPRVILGDATIAYCAEPDPLNYTCLVWNVRDNDLTGLVLPVGGMPMRSPVWVPPWVKRAATRSGSATM